MTPLSLLQALWAKDATVTRSGDGLRVSVPTGLSPRQREQITEHKPALLLLCDELVWRIEAMFAQLEPGKAFPLLVAKRLPAQSGRCLSCCEPTEGRRCPLCNRAAQLVTAEAMRVRPVSPTPGSPEGEPPREE